MRAVKTSGMNHNFGPPAGHEATISDLPCLFADEGYGDCVFSVWELSDEERQAIANGYNVRLGVFWLGAMPPVSLGVTHETS